jgi:hypothetical protein
MEFEVLNNEAMVMALKAANAGAREIEKDSIATGRVDLPPQLRMKNTKWRHGPTNFQLADVEVELGLGPRDGLFPIPVIIDEAVGEEVVLYLRDQTPFMQALKRVRPFQLFLKVGVGRNHFGPVPFLLFYVPNPRDESHYFVAYDLYLDPGSNSQVALWRKLANQTHWHLFLVGAGNQQEDFFEFENNFRLGESLDSIQAACENIQMIDFDRAKAEFGDKYSIKDLYRM